MTSLKIEKPLWIGCPDQDYLVQLVQPIDSVPDEQSPNLFNVLVSHFTLKQSYHFFYNRVGIKTPGISLERVLSKISLIDTSHFSLLSCFPKLSTSKTNNSITLCHHHQLKLSILSFITIVH